MAAEHRLHNPGPYPLTIDNDGRLLDVDAVLEGNPNGVRLKQLIESGQLTDLGPVGELPQSTAADEKPGDEKPPAPSPKTKD